MLEQSEPVQSEVLSSLLQWWSEMGVGALVDEVPQRWLGRIDEKEAAASDRKPAPARAVASPKPAATEAATPIPLTLPSDYAALLEWLNTSADLPMAGPPAQRIAASGTPGDLMVMIDMPDREDVNAKQLISGEAGILFDKMLSAMNRSRDQVYIVAFCPGRTPSGNLQPQEIEILAPIALHHIAMARPKGVWIMSQAVSRALLGADATPGLGSLRKINHEGGNVEAVASYSPRFLLQQPKRKGAAWTDMQALMRGIDA
jgi:uracil-DNA glycosylase